MGRAGGQCRAPSFAHPFTHFASHSMYVRELFPRHWCSGALPYPLGPSGCHTARQSPWHNLQDGNIWESQEELSARNVWEEGVGAVGRRTRKQEWGKQRDWWGSVLVRNRQRNGWEKMKKDGKKNTWERMEIWDMGREKQKREKWQKRAKYKRNKQEKLKREVLCSIGSPGTLW